MILAYTDQPHRLARHISRTAVHARHRKTPVSRTGDPVGFLKRNRDRVGTHWQSTLRRVADRHQVAIPRHRGIRRLAVQAQHHRVLLDRGALILDHHRNHRTLHQRVTRTRRNRQHLGASGGRSNRRALIHHRSRDRVGLDRAVHIRVVDQNFCVFAININI